MKSKSYRAYVEAQSSHNPCLLNLRDFLSNPNPNRNACRVASLDFFVDSTHPISRLVRPDHLLSELELGNSAHVHPEDSDKEGEPIEGCPLQGRILIIEDLAKDLVELLGSTLDIDPLFFAMHMHSPQKKGSDRQSPDLATLPSRLRKQDYANILYHRPIIFDTRHLPGGRLLRKANIDRKVMILPSTRIGLAQHCASIIRIPLKNNCWISLVLVDPPITAKYIFSGVDDTGVNCLELPSQPFLGGYEDFMEPPSFFDEADRSSRLLRQGLLQDLMYYWAREVPPCFNAISPTLVSLSFYPLKIVAAEWVKYLGVMHHSIKQYEYSGKQLPSFPHDLDKLNLDLRALQSWRRRSMLSLRKVRAVSYLLQSRMAREPDQDCVLSLIEDYEHITVNMDDAARRLDNMLPVVTSLVQIADTRRSFAETANISRLTILALIFIPLSFVSSLFSMNSENAPGHRYFWVYFAVAVPVTLIVYLVARPPSKELRFLFDKFKSGRQQERSGQGDMPMPITPPSEGSHV